MKTVVKMTDDMVFAGHDENGNEVTIDMRPLKKKEGLSPAGLTLCALAACGGVDILAILKKKKKQVDKMVISTEAHRNSELPKPFEKIHCHYQIASPNLQEQEFHKIASLVISKYCMVASSLKAIITFSVEVQNP